jgi:uncharacterized membrane protein
VAGVLNWLAETVYQLTVEDETVNATSVADGDVELVTAIVGLPPPIWGTLTELVLTISVCATAGALSRNAVEIRRANLLKNRCVASIWSSTKIDLPTSQAFACFSSLGMPPE